MCVQVCVITFVGSCLATMEGVSHNRLMGKGDMGLQKLIVIRCIRCTTIMYIYKLNRTLDNNLLNLPVVSLGTCAWRLVQSS